MKILMLADGMDVGGAETHIEALAQGLKELGHGIEIFSNGGRLADRMEERGIPQWRYPAVGRSFFSLRRAKKLLKSIVERGNFQILHAHTRRTALLIKGIEEASDIGSVVTVHAAYPRRPWMKGLCYWGEQTVAVSEDLRVRLCDSFGVAAERICVIPNGVDIRRFRSPVHSPEPQTVLFASRLDEDCAEGARLLCLIVPKLKERFPKLRIEIAGGGNALPSLRELIGQPNQEIAKPPSVTLLGRAEGMEEIYGRNSVFVGVSRAAMEASACGCAVILCGNEGYGGILDEASLRVHGLTNFCCRGEPLPTKDALERDLIQLLSAAKETEEMAATVQVRVREEFSMETMARETEAVYRRLMGGEKNGEGKTV